MNITVGEKAQVVYNPNLLMMTMPIQKLESVFDECAADMDELFARCVENAPNYGIQADDFKATLRGAVEKYLVDRETGATPTANEVRQFLSELQSSDLFLAMACARGNENAWWEFDHSHRSYIERTARHLASAETYAEEVIDHVYVELYGTRVIDGARMSKFATYSGRGSLRGWLRTVVWHAMIDLHRAKHDEVSIDEWTESGGEGQVRPGWDPNQSGESAVLTNIVYDRYRNVTTKAMDSAMSELEDHEKLLLLYYHVEELKLREIARLVETETSPLRSWFQRKSQKREEVPEARVHESTIMRWLDKTYAKILKSFRTALNKQHGLTQDEIKICLEMAMTDFDADDVRKHLSNTQEKLGKEEN
jgi:RNA polymerase sigma-70 factor (ECF subfamily)